MSVRRRLVVYVQGYDPRGLPEYYRMFRQEFRKTLALYGLTVCAISGAVAVVFAVRERPIPVRPLAAQSLVGLALFVDLVAVSHAGIRRVLRCWLVGLTATAVSLWVLVQARPPMSMVDAWHCALVVAGIVATLLVIVAWQAVRSPIS